MRPTANDVFVCADVGGTFTDCMVGWNDSQGNAYCRRMKVLSSGLLRCRLAGCRRVEETADLLVRLELPAELFTDQEASTDGASLADDFFRSAGMSLVVDGTSIPMGVIDSWDTSSGEMAVKPQDGAAFDSPPQGALIEIDCRLEAPVLATRLILGIPIGQALPRLSVRLGTTRGTNALLTRSGAPTALVINHGFGDALLIGEQDRPDLFDLAVYKEPPLAEHLMEIRGRIDATGTETEPLVEPEIEMALETLRSCGVESIAICLLNAYLNPLHEQAVEKLARQAGFTCVSRSSEVAPLIKLVARAETTSLDAYLSPVLTEYVNTVRKQFGGAECDLTLMTSSGNLVPDDQFRGRDSVLSGPAGGVVGLQTVAMHAGCPLAIGLDMGGTSTDVTRFDGQVGRRYESRLSGLRIMTPMMDIHTVAAGGGSICDFQGGRLVVGPESAGAAPGPACYGSGGPLTVTDINLLLGRVLSSRFPFPLDRAAAEERLEFVAGRMAEPPETRVALAEGFLEIAITHMAEAVRAITTARGVDVRDHALVGFGGAAAQHVCRVAEALGIRQIIDHPQGSILSAVGIGAARLGNVKTVGIYRTLQDVSSSDVEQEFRRLLDSLGHVPSDQDVDPSSSRNDQWDVRYELDLRYVGTDESLAIEVPIESTRSFCGTDLDACADRFHEAHQGRFGYQRIEQPIELVSLRCEVQEPDTSRRAREVWLFGQSASRIRESSERSETTQVFERGGWQSYDVFDRATLVAGKVIPPRSLVVSDQSTLVVESGWEGRVANDGTITLEATPDAKEHQPIEGRSLQTSDAVSMEIIARRLQSIADAMGEVLRRTAVSVNVKERLDFSCAIFAADGTLIANAPHVPVHLGAMGHTVRHLMTVFPQMSEGDCYVSNDPYAGGSHLPDVTLVTPVFCEEASDSPTYFVASRAHHAEIGGRTPGSMPPMATCLDEEGVLISAFALHRGGRSHEAELAEQLRSGRYPSRNVDENLADLRAQVAAGSYGAEQLVAMVRECSLSHTERMIQRLLHVADESVQRWIATLPESPLRFNDRLDDGTPVCVSLRRMGKRLEVDFDGTGGVHSGGFNATKSIVSSAVLYVMRCYCESNLPLCEGALRSIDLIIPTGLLSPPRGEDPSSTPAVVAGNVETSQRVVDVLLGALGQSATDQPVLRAVAASQGTMNNVLIGNDAFGYYETIGGGAGATVFGSGADGVHTHMTNTRITDPEVIEARMPMRLRQFAIRLGSGGKGKHAGGDGLIREYEFQETLTVSLITGRRTSRPFGACGGEPGQSGRNVLIRKDGSEVRLGFTEVLSVSAGDRLRIETPGGGGWGEA